MEPSPQPLSHWERGYDSYSSLALWEREAGREREPYGEGTLQLRAALKTKFITPAILSTAVAAID